MEADLEERTAGSTIYLLVIREGKTTREIEVGHAAKDYTKDVTPSYQKNRQELADKLGIPCDLPTPPLLQYFSSKPLTDKTINGQRYNIHPVTEKIMVVKILEELAKLDPSITGEGKQQLTKIGNKQLGKYEFLVLKKLYQIFCNAQAL